MLRVFLFWPVLSGACIYIGYASVRFGEEMVVWCAVLAFYFTQCWRWFWWCIGIGGALGCLFAPAVSISFDAWLHQDRARLPRIERVDAAWAKRVRAYGVDHFLKLFPAREAGLATGLLYGEANFTRQDKMLIRNLGISHMVAVSGANLSFLLHVASMLWRRSVRKRFWRGWIEQAVIVGLVIMTGAASSMVRAGIMALIALWAPLAGKPVRFLRSLVVSIVCMCLVWPDVLLLDIGFQFSIAACLGLVMAGSEREGRPSLLEVALRTNMWAWLWTLPLQLWLFQEWSSIGMVLGLLLAPYIEVLQVGLVLTFLVPHPRLAKGVMLGVQLVWRLLDGAVLYAQPVRQWVPVTMIGAAYVVLFTLLIHKITKTWGMNPSRSSDDSFWKWLYAAVLWGVRWSVFFDTMPDLVLSPFVSMLRTSARQT